MKGDVRSAFSETQDRRLCLGRLSILSGIISPKGLGLMVTLQEQMIAIGQWLLTHCLPCPCSTFLCPIQHAWNKVLKEGKWIRRIHDLEVQVRLERRA